MPKSSVVRVLRLKSYKNQITCALQKANNPTTKHEGKDFVGSFLELLRAVVLRAVLESACTCLSCFIFLSPLHGCVDPHTLSLFVFSGLAVVHCGLKGLYVVEALDVSHPCLEGLCLSKLVVSTIFVHEIRLVLVPAHRGPIFSCSLDLRRGSFFFVPARWQLGVMMQVKDLSLITHYELHIT